MLRSYPLLDPRFPQTFQHSCAKLNRTEIIIAALRPPSCYNSARFSFDRSHSTVLHSYLRQHFFCSGGHDFRKIVNCHSEGIRSECPKNLNFQCFREFRSAGQSFFWIEFGFPTSLCLNLTTVPSLSSACSGAISPRARSAALSASSPSPFKSSSCS